MLSLVQLLRQAPAWQVEGAQEMDTPVSQLPSPSHRPAGTKLPLPSQLACLQTVPAGQRLQPPCPLHVPIWPQLLSGSRPQTPRLSIAPAGAGTQRPASMGSLHETQGPVQATLQQTPSAQNPESHWVPSSQGCPACRCTPQAPFTQTSVSQSRGQTQASPSFSERQPGPVQASSTPGFCAPRGAPPSAIPTTTVLKAAVSQPPARPQRPISNKRFHAGPPGRLRMVFTFASSRFDWR